MANQIGGVHAVPQLVKSDDEILPHGEWLLIGKSNCYINADNPQINPVFRVALDILRQTSFFRDFTASSTIPSIYIQQFWNTVSYDRVTEKFHCPLDEERIELTKETLGSALQIMPISDDAAFVTPPNPETLLAFVNELGYPREVTTISSIATNDMFHP